jgi:hypothetical protein
MSDERIERTFQVNQPARLEVRNIRGSVEIRPGEDGVISIIAVKQEHFGDTSGTQIELTQEADGLVKAITRFPDPAWAWLTFSWPCKVDYVIKAPRNCSLKVKSVSNSALVEGFEGEFNVDTVSGEVTLSNLNGPIRMHSVSGAASLSGLTGSMNLGTVSGKINAERVSGPLQLDTVSGDVRLSESDLASVQAKTVSGQVRVQTPLNAGPYRFGSVSGGIFLQVPADSHCTAELHTISGRVSTTLPQTASSRQNRTQVVDIQGGGVKVYLNSVSGELSMAS